MVLLWSIFINESVETNKMGWAYELSDKPGLSKARRFWFFST